jgi:hypothetical protein
MGVDVVPASLDGSANLLLELAGLFQAGRPELAQTGRVRAPYAHPDVAGATRAVTEFGGDQYQDAVALLAALSLRLAAAADAYRSVDAASAGRIEDLLANSTYRPAR